MWGRGPLHDAIKFTLKEQPCFSAMIFAIRQSFAFERLSLPDQNAGWLGARVQTRPEHVDRCTQNRRIQRRAGGTPLAAGGDPARSV
jgi:hypothetical protein